MHVISLDEVAKTIPKLEGAKGVSKQVPISKEHGSPNFSFRVFTVEAEGHTPYHQHAFEHLNYIISGQGKIVRPDGDLEIKKGDFALILPNEKHQYRNTSNKDTLVLLCAVPIAYE